MCWNCHWWKEDGKDICGECHGLKKKNDSDVIHSNVINFSVSGMSSSSVCHKSLVVHSLVGAHCHPPRSKTVKANESQTFE